MWEPAHRRALAVLALCPAVCVTTAVGQALGITAFSRLPVDADFREQRPGALLPGLHSETMTSPGSAISRSRNARSANSWAVRSWKGTPLCWYVRVQAAAPSGLYSSASCEAAR